MITLKEIAVIRTDFPEKFGIPRQSGLVEELRSTLVFHPEFRAGGAAGAGAIFTPVAYLGVLKGGT